MQPVRDLGTRVFQLFDRDGDGPAARAKRAQRRLVQVVIVLGGYIVLAYAAAVIAVLNVEGIRKDSKGQDELVKRVMTRRGGIFDRNLNVFAYDRRSDSLSVNPRWLLPPTRATAKTQPLKAPKWPGLMAKAANGCDPWLVVTSSGAKAAARPSAVQSVWDRLQRSGVVDPATVLAELEQAAGRPATAVQMSTLLAAAPPPSGPAVAAGAPAAVVEPRAACAAWLQTLTVTSARAQAVASLVDQPASEVLRWPFTAPSVRAYRDRVACRLSTLVEGRPRWQGLLCEAESGCNGWLLPNRPLPGEQGTDAQQAGRVAAVEAVWAKLASDGLADPQDTLRALEQAAGLAAVAETAHPKRQQCAQWLQGAALAQREAMRMVQWTGEDASRALHWPTVPQTVKATDPGAARDADSADLQRRIHADTNFIYLAKNLPEDRADAVRKAIDAGELPRDIVLEQEFVRTYPNDFLAGPLIGRLTSTGAIEASMDSTTRGQATYVHMPKDAKNKPRYVHGTPEPGLYGGQSVVTTIDQNIQAVAEHYLQAATTEFQADFGFAVVMDVDTGEVVAMATSPSMNPNIVPPKPGPGDPPLPRHLLQNLALVNQCEPGSTQKVVNQAIAIEEGKATLTEVFVTGAGMPLPGKTIKDDHPHGSLTGEQCLTVSSNICNCKMAMRVDRNRYYDYLVNLGYGRRLDLGINGESSGQLDKPDKWSLVQYCNIAFGQGIAATPLQMVASFAAVANGGTWRRPRLVRQIIGADGRIHQDFQVEPGHRVFSAETSRQMLQAMATVTRPRDPNNPKQLGGTGTKARMANYTIGGKTGTAQQANGPEDCKAGRGCRGYSDTHWVGSFIGVTPIERPKLVILVGIDTPKKFDPALGKIARYGGIVAAPVVREIARFALPYLGVAPSPGAPYLDRDDPEKARRLDGLRAAAHASPEQVADAIPLPPPFWAGSEPVAMANAPTAVAQGDQSVVPNVRGLPMRLARQRMAAVGLQLTPSGSGLAIDQEPAAGQTVSRGALVKATFQRVSAALDLPKVEAAVQPAAPAAAAVPAALPVAKPAPASRTPATVAPHQAAPVARGAAGRALDGKGADGKAPAPKAPATAPAAMSKVAPAAPRVDSPSLPAPRPPAVGQRSVAGASAPPRAKPMAPVVAGPDKQTRAPSTARLSGPVQAAPRKTPPPTPAAPRQR